MCNRYDWLPDLSVVYILTVVVHTVVIYLMSMEAAGEYP